jgi:transposase-like protein
LDVEVKFINANFKTYPCPRCGTDSPRHDKAVRHGIDIGLERPMLLVIELGVYRCPKCRKKRTFRTPLAFLGPHEIYVKRCRQKVVETIDLDQMPIGRAADRVKRDFNIAIVPSTAWEWYHERRPTLEEIGEYEHLVVASFSGVICVDELYDGGYGVLCARDPLNGRTIAYELCEHVNQEEVTKFFRRLKAMGIEAEVAVTDDSPLYPKAIKAVWKACKQQLCRFHWTKNVISEVNKGVRDYRESLPKPEKRAKRGRPKKDEALLQAAAEAAQSARDAVRKARYNLVARRENLDDKQQERLAVVLANHPPLREVRAFMDDFYAIFDGKPRPSEAEWRRRRLLANPAYAASPHLKAALDILKDDAKFEKVALYLHFANLNSTSNDVERDNRGYRKHQKAHYRFRSKESIQTLLDHRLVRMAPTAANKLKKRFGNPNWAKKKPA